MVTPRAAVEHPCDPEAVSYRARSGAEDGPAAQLLDLVCPTLEVPQEVVVGADAGGERVGRLHELGSGLQALVPRVTSCDRQRGSERVRRAGCILDHQTGVDTVRRVERHTTQCAEPSRTHGEVERLSGEVAAYGRHTVAGCRTHTEDHQGSLQRPRGAPTDLGGRTDRPDRLRGGYGHPAGA